MKTLSPAFIQMLCLLWAGQQVLAQAPAAPAPAQVALGLEFSDPQFVKSSQQVFSTGYGAAPTDVPAFTLKDDLPKPGDQGNFNSCVAWATGYAFMSNLLWTGQLSTAPADTVEPEADRSKPLSPCFIYNRCATRNLVETVGNTRLPRRSSRLTGPQGPNLWFQEAFVCLEKYGTCFHQQMTSPVGLPSAAALTTARQFEAVLSMTSIPPDEQMLDAIKSCLQNQKTPVLVGMKVDQRFTTTNTHPFDEEERDAEGTKRKIWKTFRGASRGGHAMVIIGWDDKLRCYHVMNSWGAWGGNGGYLWIHYDLMKQYAGELWQLSGLQYRPGRAATAMESYYGLELPPEIDFYCSLAERFDRRGTFRKNYFNITPADLQEKKIAPGTVLQLQEGLQVYCRTQRPQKTVKGLAWPTNDSDPIIQGPTKVEVRELVSFQINERNVDGTVTHFWIGCKRVP